ncbi:MAG TPA: hypothetical protein VG672_18920 [Bryobacteraceae bacterium]|nr:hypothetical protein [Bryobacteraceae bacterium]
MFRIYWLQRRKIQADAELAQFRRLKSKPVNDPADVVLKNVDESVDAAC